MSLPPPPNPVLGFARTKTLKTTTPTSLPSLYFLFFHLCAALNKLKSHFCLHPRLFVSKCFWKIRKLFDLLQGNDKRQSFLIAFLTFDTQSSWCFTPPKPQSKQLSVPQDSFKDSWQRATQTPHRHKGGKITGRELWYSCPLGHAYPVHTCRSRQPRMQTQESWCPPTQLQMIELRWRNTNWKQLTDF